MNQYDPITFAAMQQMTPEQRDQYGQMGQYNDLAQSLMQAGQNVKPTNAIDVLTGIGLAYQSGQNRDKANAIGQSLGLPTQQAPIDKLGGFLKGLF